MKRVAAVVLLCFYATAASYLPGPEPFYVTAALGDVARLPCYPDGNVPLADERWFKDYNGPFAGSGGPSDPQIPTPTSDHFSVLQDGLLVIHGVTTKDEGAYACLSKSERYTWPVAYRLKVVPGPGALYTSVMYTSFRPSDVLDNGTMVVYRGSSVDFTCSGLCNPPQEMTWTFRGASSSNISQGSTSECLQSFRRWNIQPSDQGVYTCEVHNLDSHQRVNKSLQLLVYYFPDRHPECVWAQAQDSSHITINCTWSGAYPTPTLSWAEDLGDQQADEKGPVYSSEVTESLSVTLNRSMLSSGRTVTCSVEHPAPSIKKTCSLTFMTPYPEGEPLAAALEATNVTLTCTEATSTPPASTGWRKGLQQEEIVPGSKYVLSEEGPVFKLTILHVSKDDEGVYFCRSENPLGVRELEVYLTVRTSSTYTGAIIGVFIAALIVGSGLIVAKTVYSSRHRMCLGGGFGQTGEDRGDVLSLVDSDDEEIFQAAVPRLPPLTNGHNTTLVQIHHIPSSDHEDADTGAKQQEDTAQTEESGDLVTI